MQLENTPGISAFSSVSSKPENKFEVGFRNMTSRFFGPLDETHRIIPKVLSKPCILKLFCFIESIKIKVIQVYARNNVNFNQRIGRAFHRPLMPRLPEHRAYQRGLAGAQIPVQPDHHAAAEQRRQTTSQRNRRGFVRQGQGKRRKRRHRAMILSMQNNVSTTHSTTEPATGQLDGTRLARQIKRWGKDLGFSAIGIASPDVTAAAGRLNRWLALGRHGGLDYMVKHVSLRTHPDQLVPGIQSVITAALPYWPDATAAADVLATPTRGYVSRYALGRDYHKSVRNRLQRLAERIRDELATIIPETPFAYRVFSDSAPVMEVEFAHNSGIAWRGKHTVSLTRNGSWHFVGEIFTSLLLPADPVAEEHCGSCRRCINNCPTSAIVAPYEVDARLCISYLTIEHFGAIPVPLRPAIGNRIYGCDDCQLCCPWNRFARIGAPDFAPRNGLDAPELVSLFSWDAQEFEQRLAGSPIRRIGHERWLRNIAVALGNAPPTRESRAALNARADHPSGLVREHVAWALSRSNQAA